MRRSHRSLLSAVNQCLWISTRIQSIQHRKDNDALRWKSLLWRRYLWSVQMPSTIKWCHNLLSSMAFRCRFDWEYLRTCFMFICDWLASISNRFKKWGVNGSHIRYQRVWCTVKDIKEFDALSIHAQHWRFIMKEIKQIYFVIVVFGDCVYFKVHIVHHVTSKTRPSLFSFCSEGGVTGGNLSISPVRQIRDVLF